MTAAVEARDLDRRIRDGWQSVATSIASLQRLIAEARSAEVWRELGFASWTAYVADVTSAQPVRLEREQRRELVAMLTAEGMSTRAIAPVVGVSRETVASDLRLGGRNLPPAPAPNVAGLDGKTYSRPAPQRHLTAVPERIDPATGEVLTGPRPAPAKPKVIDDAESVEFAKDYCAGIAKAVTSLAPAQHANMRAAWIKYWAAGSLGASPAQRDFMTATNLRLIGAGLIELADEWETR